LTHRKPISQKQFLHPDPHKNLLLWYKNKKFLGRLSMILLAYGGSKSKRLRGLVILKRFSIFERNFQDRKPF
jgi:hypothetical protein